MALLEVKNIRKEFGGIVALDDVSIDIEADKKYVILGPNGAGKTTLFNCITGYYRPDAGTVRYRGEDVTDESDFEKARRGIRRTFQEVNVFDELDVLENVSLASFETPPRDILETLDLFEIRNKQGDELTLFERKRVALALALDGELLLLDEVYSGLNPAEKPPMTDYINRVAEDRTLILIEHDIETAFALADRMIVLYNGEVLSEGTTEEIRNDEQVRELYFGEQTV
jgi:branched-chain amino acid transport system ATP-binding protein